MHASIIEAREHRDRERARAAANRERRATNDALRAQGKDPARMDAPHPEGNHRARREASRPVRQFFWELDKFFKGLARVTQGQ